MKLLFVTAQTPYGKGETFILGEMLEAKHQGIDLLIIPRNSSREVFHKDAKELLENTIWLPLINLGMIFCFCRALLTNIALWKILGSIACCSRKPWIFVKNMMVLPKGIFVSKIVQEESIRHIHAHWGSTTATMAYIISRITGISWSFTLHRWDIRENNMLNEKVRSAKFVRCISQQGKAELLHIIGDAYKNKIETIHMGVRSPEILKSKEKKDNSKKFTVGVPANLIEVKGHRYLIEACFILVEQGIKNIQCIFYGEGPLRGKLENLIKKKELTGYIKMAGAVSHEEIIRMYHNGETDAVILSSIITNKGEHEGIPVALMEAMAYGIPVISTDTGGIVELLSGGAGVTVEEKNPNQLAGAIKNLMENSNLQRRLKELGREKIQNDFNIHKNVQTLLKLMVKEKEFASG